MKPEPPADPIQHILTTTRRIAVVGASANPHRASNEINTAQINTAQINTAQINTAWLIGTARHKLIDHWRRTERRKEELADLWDDVAVADTNDTTVDVIAAKDVLEQLAPTHRAVLTLRYLDDLPVVEVAAVIGRTVHATEALLTRAKAAFRNHAVHQETS